MKKFVAFLFLILTSFVFAQTGAKKYDKIVTKDYVILEGVVSKISSKDIEYTAKGSTVLNVIEINKVAKIDFANGKSQNFLSEEVASHPNVLVTPDNNSQAVANQVKKNTIAVLPIPFVNSETMGTSAEMAKFAQNDVYNKLIERADNIAPLVVQDLRTTNYLLKKAGVDYTNIDETPIEELEKILGVDHIIAAKVSYIVKVNTMSTGRTNANVKANGNNSVKVDDFSYSNTTENKRFDYTVYFDIYKEGQKIYTQSRQPFLNEKDSWMDSMQYLLKRCPLYKKL